MHTMTNIYRFRFSKILLGLILLAGCSSAAKEILPSSPTVEIQEGSSNTQQTATEEITVESKISGVSPTGENNAVPPETMKIKTPVGIIQAEVGSVSVTGQPGAFNFSVEISSPDQGCDQYADWWEVITPDGELIYRRVLLHSHVDEQPFSRSGGPVPIEEQEIVLIRAHMHPGGYGNQAMQGSPGLGFEPIELSPEFAADLSEIPPLPEDCAF
jgi:hypothetical protein